MNNKSSEQGQGRDIYAHTTSLGNLRRILDSGGSVLSLRHMAQRMPDSEISVEPLPVPVRTTLRAAEAYSRMKGIKDTDSIFLTRSGYLPNYGDVVITKNLSGGTVRPGNRLNSIPEEFTTRRPLSLRHNSTIFVPEEHLDELRKAYPRLRLFPKGELMLRSFGLKDRAGAFYDKVMDRLGLTKQGSDEDGRYRRLFGRNARLVGSEALGINVPGSSDIDVFVPYKRQYHFNRAVENMPRKYPGLVMNSVSKNRADKKTFTGRVNGQDMDVVLAYGPRAEKFRDAFSRARDRLTDTRREEIVREKERLKNAWFFGRLRYKRYKNRVAEELGLKEAYF